jgi:L-arabinokinase
LLAVYVSGHGFGHATRTAEVLRVLRRREPALRVVVATTAPAFLFEEVIARPLELRRVQGDVGLAQHDALAIDEEGTLAAWRRLMDGWEALVEAEARWLATEGARLVFGDIPPLAFAAAARAGVRSVALGNFSWDWIYRHLSRRHRGFEEPAAWAAKAYREAGLLLRLPFAGDLDVFGSIEDVPLVARRPAVGKKDARRRLGLDGRPAVLLSFGGIGLPGLRLEAFEKLSGHQFILTGVASGGDGVRRISAGELAAAGLGYPDLVGAADVVVTKPGYGIVTDCIGAGTRLIYTDRGDFPEYPVMVAEMAHYLPAVHVANDALCDGRLEAPLAEVLGLPFPPSPRIDGAELAARRLLALLDAGAP